MKKSREHSGQLMSNNAQTFAKLVNHQSFLLQFFLAENVKPMVRGESFQAPRVCQQNKNEKKTFHQHMQSRETQ